MKRAFQFDSWKKELDVNLENDAAGPKVPFRRAPSVRQERAGMANDTSPFQFSKAGGLNDATRMRTTKT